jgi:4-hydroxy-3-methylbut-2-enyl diphosphate reductase
MLIAGLGGGLSEAMTAGDVVVATSVRGPDGAEIPLPGAALLAGQLRRAGLRVHLGPVLSTSSVVGDLSDADGLADRLGGGEPDLAVDMESAFLFASGQVGGLSDGVAAGPRAVLRVVLDTPGRPLRSAGTPWRAARALAALRRSAPAISAWAAATGPREVLLAAPRSFCAGVGRAIEIVERALEIYGEPVYVRRQIVHNAHVVDDLRQRGAIFVQEVEEIPPGSVAVLAAHGVAPSVRAAAAARDLQVIDATCPLVTKVHTEVRRYASRGSTVLLIGHREHEEVVGTRGEAPSNVLVVEDAEQAATIAPVDPDDVAYVMQTTLAMDEAEQIASVLRERFPSLSAPRRDDICYATTNRQMAVREIARQSDVVLVVGSQNSSNSLRLVEVAQRAGAAAYLVEDAGEVDLRWLAGARRIGITAGASAPPQLVDELVSALSGLGPVTVREEEVIEESVQFTLPKEVS